jgi:GT2 family glycosyltransferase
MQQDLTSTQTNQWPRVAVVILNYGTRQWLEKFLPSVLATEYDNLEIVVADNASKDDSVSFLKEHYPQVTLLQFHKNLGYTGGYNKALGLLKADYFVLLNSDIEVPSNWLAPMVQMAMENPKIGAIQPTILDWNNKQKYEYAGAAGGFIDKYGYPFCKGRIFNTIENENPDYQSSGKIFWASGACMFVKASAFENAGGLEERFFAHMEEIDLCWRLQLIGYEVLFCPDSKVYHVGGATLNKAKPQKTFLNFHNSLAMLAKNLPKNKILQVIIMRLIIDHVAAYKFLFEGKILHFFAVARAHFTFIVHFRKWIKLRDPKHPQTDLSSIPGVLQTSIVKEYFISKKKTFGSLNFK